MLKPEDIAAIFEWIELLLIASLKRNLARHKDEEEQEGFTWSAWQAEKLRSINTFRRQSRAIMDRYKGQIDDETRQLLEEQFEEGMNGAIQELEEAQPEKPAKQPEAQPQAEETTTAEPAPVPTEPPTVSEPPAEITVEAMPEPVTPEPVIPEPVVKTEPQFFGVDRTKMDKLIEDVTQLEERVETAALRMTDDVYRQTVNRVQLAMASGSIPYAKAVDMAVADFLAQGINCIEYRDGRRVNIADYVRMVLRTTSTRASLQGKSESWKAQGYDMVLVSAYGMCSKTCLPWQGRVYINDAFMDWSGDTRYEDGVKYGRSQYCGKWFPLLSSAIAEGLFHPNCRHGIGLYIDGVTELPKPMDNSDIERRYKEEQHQRALERDVRKAKRKVEGFMEPADIQKAKADLREAQKNVRDYIDETNTAEGDRVLVRQPIQEKIYGGDVRIGSSADPYEPPKKPAPFKPAEGFATEVNIPAPENQTVEYTEQKIPERLKSVETGEPKADIEAVNNSSLDNPDESGIIEERGEFNESHDLQPFGKKSKIGSGLFSEEAKTRLYERENEIRNNDYEKAIVFNPDGTEQLQKDGDADSVTFSYEERKLMKGCILTHNHPNTSPFSPNDIAFLLRNGLSEIRVCFNGGTYILQRTWATVKSPPSIDSVQNDYYEEYDKNGKKYNDIAAKNGKSIISYLRQIDESTVRALANKYKLNFILEVDQDE